MKSEYRQPITPAQIQPGEMEDPVTKTHQVDTATTRITSRAGTVTTASDSAETMSVRVIDRSGWGTSAPYPAIRRVTISAYCPACGGRRGEPHNRNFHEDDEWLSCDVWENPCGHVDMYEAVLTEARALMPE